MADEDFPVKRGNSDIASISSSISSLFSNEDLLSFPSSGNISGEFSGNSSSSGEFNDALVAKLMLPPPSTAAPVRNGVEINSETESLGSTTVLLTPPTTVSPLVVPVRQRCVGKNANGVSYGFTSVIGRRKEMEDAVRVVPGFITSSCDHVGGCTAPGSKSSNAASSLHFFGVYDGHGGSQVL
ncbi:hypothetical protein LIER_27279 [Lithospermum erythrorhizon]|uniref:Protein-serine/threonine phosphatase n=1 Tax=Lithospermum erythrorhizon TaxID=34254 RepID=A0AAV3RF19_LITER